MKKGNVSIMLVLVMILLSTITTAAVSLAFSTTRDTTTLSLGERALSVAESGAENAILNLLRNPSYTGDPSLPIGPGTATIVTDGTTITSTGAVGNLVRTIQATVVRNAGSLTITSWREL